MHDNRNILQKRVERTLNERILPRQVTPLDDLTLHAWRIPLNKNIVAEPVNFQTALTANYTPFTIGSTWGAPWQTTWFKATATIPAELPENITARPNDRLEAIIDLGWDDHSVGFQCEALVRDPSGRTIKALNPKNRWIPLPNIGQSATPITFYIEAAANPLLLAVPPFQPTDDGDPLTSSHTELYTLRSATVCLVHEDVRALALDIAVLHELVAAETHLTDHHWRILFALNDALDALDLDDVPGTAASARDILRPVLNAPKAPNSHHLSALGHAHIDTAWLWPLRETRRKVIRTIANVVHLVERGSGLIFALPAAQHMAWLQEDDPALFERLRICVRDGSIVPVGGMWVEPDAVLPGGEAMCRQLVEGMSWIEDTLDYTCTEIWLPDSFGYSAALPQLAREAGIQRFLTQKISWNQVNAFPHHTLQWEGIDGSRIFTHFPPVDTYGSDVSGAHLAHATSHFKDKGRASCSLLPFGYGDGGGGPTREMIERINRYSTLEGAPSITIESPETFFERAEADYPNPPVWVGELYLELHRGTLTSQIGTKQGNRRSEARLREAELWCTTAATRGLMDYPYDELRELWRTVLLCQFHDILPGTSIAWVHREVEALHADVHRRLDALVDSALSALTTGGEADESAAGETSPAPLIANASSFTVSGIEPFSINQMSTPPAPVTVDAANRTLHNKFIHASFDASGACVSLVDRETGREYIPSGEKAGQLHLHQDFPNMWDAWDIDPFYRGSLRVIDTGQLLNIGTDGDHAYVTARANFGDSSATLTWTLGPHDRHLNLAVEVEWKEREKLLKLTFPVDIHTDHAQYETQMGHITRPTHVNTSWDAYKFEVSAHRWLRLADASSALAIANDATYGWDITRQPHDNRGTWSLVRATLAKSARYPDPRHDEGVYSWNFRLVPGATVLDAIGAGQDLNLKTRTSLGRPTQPLLRVDGAVLESLSMAPDKSGDIVARIYEAEGGPAHVRLHIDGANDVRCTNLLYRPSNTAPPVTSTGEGTYEFDLASFQVATVRISVPSRKAAQ
ncbi:MAG: alpha-mannosidase [Actinobacteria bacterium]|nr:MAG: alpha-mannosidase [Actinomycetota bacterium]